MPPYDSPKQSSLASASTATKVVPLLQALNRAEELTGALAMRLDPITQHAPNDNDKPPASTVTSRIDRLGDTLQYLLEHIEL